MSSILPDSDFEGSGWVPVHQIDLSSDTLSVRPDRPGGVRNFSLLGRGADRSAIFLAEADISNGPISLFHAP